MMDKVSRRAAATTLDTIYERRISHIVGGLGNSSANNISAWWVCSIFTLLSSVFKIPTLQDFITGTRRQVA